MWTVPLERFIEKNFAQFINCAKKKDVDITEDDYKILNILKYGRNHSFHGNNTQCHVSQLVCTL